MTTTTNKQLHSITFLFPNAILHKNLSDMSDLSSKYSNPDSYVSHNILDFLKSFESELTNSTYNLWLSPYFNVFSPCVPIDTIKPFSFRNMSDSSFMDYLNYIPTQVDIVNLSIADLETVTRFLLKTLGPLHFLSKTLSTDFDFDTHNLHISYQYSKGYRLALSNHSTVLTNPEPLESLAVAPNHLFSYDEVLQHPNYVSNYGFLVRSFHYSSPFVTTLASNSPIYDWCSNLVHYGCRNIETYSKHLSKFLAYFPRTLFFTFYHGPIDGLSSPYEPAVNFRYLIEHTYSLFISITDIEQIPFAENQLYLYLTQIPDKVLSLILNQPLCPIEFIKYFYRYILHINNVVNYDYLFNAVFSDTIEHPHCSNNLSTPPFNHHFNLYIKHYSNEFTRYTRQAAAFKIQLDLNSKYGYDTKLTDILDDPYLSSYPINYETPF